MNKELQVSTLVAEESCLSDKYDKKERRGRIRREGHDRVPTHA